MAGSRLSRAGLMRPSSLGLCRSCWSLRLLPQSPTETLPELLHGDLQGPNERGELRQGGDLMRHIQGVCKETVCL